MSDDPTDLFIAHLQRHATATEALASWCAPRLGAGAGRIIARVVQDAPVGPGLRHRRVQLCWGGLAVSDAENRYRPDRLPPAVCALLLESDTPFGAAIAGLHPVRQVTRLVRSQGRHFLHVTATVSIDGGVVAEVTERYRSMLLGWDSRDQALAGRLAIPPLL